MYKQVLPHFFCHSRLLKHYTSFEMYYIKVMINFTQNNHFFLYYAYHYLPLPIFFTWQRANPSIKAIHTCLEFLPTLLRNRAKLNSFFFMLFILEQICKLTFFQYSRSAGHCTHFSISLSYTYRVRVCSNNSVIVYRQIMH